MYSFPFSSQTRAPFPETMNFGSLRARSTLEAKFGQTCRIAACLRSSSCAIGFSLCTRVSAVIERSPSAVTSLVFFPPPHTSSRLIHSSIQRICGSCDRSGRCGLVPWQVTEPRDVNERSAHKSERRFRVPGTALPT